eukprot:CAMPEP_0204115512 /NCGR_PEP_ID=MMETSP0361-20130328/4869_1 /ASSEMBLY_ACC=CAM_ASM_000343 /TAXON_ID=268821 /ORGANISM="Scrippsiella Hangoei, Strain SHTV-5" /LENGTH=74 /DNA_ID=CAMNT_0051066175 /DNA_START=159 /DNA_END=380 /DNA_ORIENTATION=+
MSLPKSPKVALWGKWPSNVFPPRPQAARYLILVSTALSSKTVQTGESAPWTAKGLAATELSVSNRSAFIRWAAC